MVGSKRGVGVPGEAEVGFEMIEERMRHRRVGADCAYCNIHTTSYREQSAATRRFGKVSAAPIQRFELMLITSI